MNIPPMLDDSLEFIQEMFLFNHYQRKNSSVSTFKRIYGDCNYEPIARLVFICAISSFKLPIQDFLLPNPLILLTAMFALPSQRLSKKQLWSSIFHRCISKGPKTAIRGKGFWDSWVIKPAECIKNMKLLSWDQMLCCFFVSPNLSLLCWSLS